MVQKTVFFSGYAKLPSTITAGKLYEVQAVTVEIEPQTGMILNADCTLSTQLGRRFVRKILRGYDLDQGIEPLIAEIQARYYGGAKSALISALRMMYQQFRVFRKDHPKTVLRLDAGANSGD
ncbi:MAG TPA: DUF3870 domain-containing protein [Clostridia bacterium]|nr:DUF3870 domain-containing protein [Clostridia bacterium]